MAFDLTRTNYTLIPPGLYRVWGDFFVFSFHKKERKEPKERKNGEFFIYINIYTKST